MRNQTIQMNEQKLQFFGTLNQMDSFGDLALKQIEDLWNEGGVRLREDDLESMNRTLRNIESTVRKVRAFNHKRFGKITNSAIENEGEKTKEGGE